MGQLNIKSDRADRLVSRLVALTGESKTEAVITALEERLARLERERDRERRIARILDLADRVREKSGGRLMTNEELDDLLYDPATGAPR